MTVEYSNFGDILVGVNEGVATITLNRPDKRNALTESMWTCIPEVVSFLDNDKSVRVVIVRGGGNQAFSAGADIAEFECVYSSQEKAFQYNVAIRRAQLAIEKMSKPTLAMIYGACVGGGCGIALSCDFRFASDNARLGITPSRLGLAYSVPDTRRLVALVGPSRSKDILFSGRLLSADEAFRIGLLDFISDTDYLESTVYKYVDALKRNSSQSLRVSKMMINSLSGVDKKSEEELDAAFNNTFFSEDFKEGVSAFLEKRPPKFL